MPLGPESVVFTLLVSEGTFRWSEQRAVWEVLDVDREDGLEQA